MTFFESTTDPFEPDPALIRVRETHIGKAVYSTREYPATAVIGKIEGHLSDDDSVSDEYTFEYDGDWQLHPDPPFRFLNHSCNPNCEFEMCYQPAAEGPASNGLYLVALRDIRCDEPLTINYNWSAEFAIPCECLEENCRGWVVAEEELDRARQLFADA